MAREFKLPLDHVPGSVFAKRAPPSGAIDGRAGRIPTNHDGDPGAASAVRLADDREIETGLLGIDRRTGLTPLHVDEVELTSVEPVTDGALRIDDPVAIVSDPFGWFQMDQ